MSDPESELQSLEKVLEESRRLRQEAGQHLEQAQWPELVHTHPAESGPPIPDQLHIPVPPLLGFQRDKGNLPLGRLTETTSPQVAAAPADPNPSLNETGGELSESIIPETAGAVINT